MNATIHRWSVALAPIVIGFLTVVVQGTAEHRIDPWVIGNALAAGCLTAFINYVRSTAGAPPQ